MWLLVLSICTLHASIHKEPKYYTFLSFLHPSMADLAEAAGRGVRVDACTAGVFEATTEDLVRAALNCGLCEKAFTPEGDGIDDPDTSTSAPYVLPCTHSYCKPCLRRLPASKHEDHALSHVCCVLPHCGCEIPLEDVEHCLPASYLSSRVEKEQGGCGWEGKECFNCGADWTKLAAVCRTCKHADPDGGGGYLCSDCTTTHKKHASKDPLGAHIRTKNLLHVVVKGLITLV